jgi:hypothetical protein
MLIKNLKNQHGNIIETLKMKKFYTNVIYLKN